MLARELYLQCSYAESQEQNELLLEWAEAAQNITGRILGLRFIGLCQSRRGLYDDAVARLRSALELAQESCCRVQALLCTMQLGATLRQQGELLPAYELVRDALDQATLPDYIQERTRICGFYGSLRE